MRDLKFRNYFQPEGLAHGSQAALENMHTKSQNKNRAFVIKRAKKSKKK